MKGFLMKKNKNIEMKIYELLGVKFFKKLAFGLRDILAIPLTIGMSKEERKEFLYDTASNYNLGKVKSLEDVKKFKKMLFINAGLHILALLICFPDFLKIIDGSASLFTIISNLGGIGINLYCIMLQRYNDIRINQFIERMKPRYENREKKIKEELKKEHSLCLEDSYKIVNKEEKEICTTFEDFIANSNIEQLKQYRDYFACFQNISEVIPENGFYNNDQHSCCNITYPGINKR